MEALDHFSSVTGVTANADKSYIFLAWLTSEMQDEKITMRGFVPGIFPIRYLGLPLSSKKWSKMECQQLIDKITERITTFVLPQSVLKAVDKRCSEYLWGTSDEQKKIALVASEKVCKPKNGD
uniref:Uncharacterized protein n=1 Tax=Nicotiana tabacum TaxID=4097 RepID=A0A1S4CUR7_TOBAC|nr:PREDICTED: uncharacterized protein LOC107822897 [Nicotiana tabacum]